MQLRQSNIDKMKAEDTTLDVLIIGGGINGAVSASALTSQGAKVGLLDRGDFASATSQESSNLVWGGIKYLEGFEFGLVRKLCKSRNHLLRHYPSSVKEIRFFVTIAKKFRHNRLFLFLGSLLYWLMGDFFTKPPRLLSTRAIEKEEGLIKTENLQGGFEYSDAYLLDNDARFVFGFVREAIDHGGLAANYCEALGSKRGADGIWVTEAIDRISGESFTIRSRVLLNTCGPYADAYNDKSGVTTEHHHLFSKGIHLLVNRLTEHKRVLTFFADDGRMFFAIPMGNRSCIGTTDTRVEELPAVVTDEDRAFVLNNINKRLRLDPPLTQEDIIAERCGVRPLVVEPRTDKDQGDWTSLSRKHIIEIDEKQKQISIFGGKLTDCLNVGQEILDAVVALGVKLPYIGHKWYGEPDHAKEEFFHQARLMKLDEMTPADADETLSHRFWRKYRMGALSLLEDIRQDQRMAEQLIEGNGYTRCELLYAARHEMIIKLEDFLRRRSKIALLVREEELRESPDLREACDVLFGEEAQLRYDEYFQTSSTPASSLPAAAPKEPATA